MMLAINACYLNRDTVGCDPGDPLPGEIDRMYDDRIGVFVTLSAATHGELHSIAD